MRASIAHATLPESMACRMVLNNNLAAVRPHVRVLARHDWLAVRTQNALAISICHWNTTD